jgi:hypothetical protein
MDRVGNNVTNIKTNESHLAVVGTNAISRMGNATLGE